jgi:hypothetical protein
MVLPATTSSPETIRPGKKGAGLDDVRLASHFQRTIMKYWVTGRVEYAGESESAATVMGW